jgi:hypothetical protein
LYFIHNYFWDQHVSRISDQQKPLKNIKMSTENKLARKEEARKLPLGFLPQAMLL